jgi:hypothetical protein
MGSAKQDRRFASDIPVSGAFIRRSKRTERKNDRAANGRMTLPSLYSPSKSIGAIYLI